jgi:phosphoglycerol transferase MdoB-like AlkP superfamily enzyme
MFQLCAPAFIYLLISLLDLILNAYVGLYSNLLVKTIVILAVTLFLNILCEKGFSEISWLTVLLAFLCIVILVLNNLGCGIYYIPSNHVTTTTNMSTTTNMPTTHYYEHIPFGTSDPAYQS